MLEGSVFIRIESSSMAKLHDFGCICKVGVLGVEAEGFPSPVSMDSSSEESAE